MRHTLSDIEEIINSANSMEFIPVKCENCGSKIKPSNIGKHSQCSIYRNHHAKSFLKRQSFPLEVKLQPPTKLNMFIVGNTVKEGYQSIAPPLTRQHVQSLRIPQPEPDLPILQQPNVQYQIVDYQHVQYSPPSQFSINLNDRTGEKQNFDNLSLYSKKEQLLPTTSREDRTARNNHDQSFLLSLNGTARSRHFLQQQITYRPTLTQQFAKTNTAFKNAANSSNKGGLFSIFSCMTEHGASIKQHQIRSQIKPNVCPCCLREAHDDEPSQSKLNNFQIQRKKILYDKWLQARARYKSIPSVSFEQAWKKHRFLKQQQFCQKIREYFY